MKTSEVHQILKKRHAEDTRQWANVIEFVGIDFLAVSLWPSRHFEVHGYEIKVSRSDWLKELKQPTKARNGMARCDFWYLAAPPGILKDGELPDRWGYVEIGAAESRLRHRPTQLRPAFERVPYIDGEPNPEYWYREAFARMARRYAYARSETDALLAHFNTLQAADPSNLGIVNPQVALDQAAMTTGRYPSAVRQRQATRRRRRRK